MDADPTKNMIVFEVKRLWKKERFIEPAPTQAMDGIKTAWRAVQNKTGARPSQVRQIYSEWEPSKEDAAFISKTFPEAQVSYSFARPTATDGWQEALEGVSNTIHTAANKRRLSEAKERRDKGVAKLFPVLRTFEAGDFFAEAIVHRPIGADLAVFLAYVGPTPEGNIGFDYVTRNSVDTSALSTLRLFEASWKNLRSGLQVSVQKKDEEALFVISHPSDMGTSALCLPDFYEQARSWIGYEELFVAFPNPSRLFLTRSGSPLISTLRQAVEQSAYWDAVALTPACYILNSSGLTWVAARTTTS